MTLPTAFVITRTPNHDTQVTLTYEDRFIRRKRLTSDDGEDFLVDLPKTVSLQDGDGLELDDGRIVKVVAAEEPLLEITGPDLARLAWHIGNRHTPCQIEDNRLLIAQDRVMEDMLAKLGADVRKVIAPFTPEGGAYGEGRTHGHSHSHSHGPTHDHSHDHAHNHQHSHEHDHD